MTRARRWWPVLWRVGPWKDLGAHATEHPSEECGDEWIGPECRTKAEALKAAREELKRRKKTK